MVFESPVETTVQVERNQQVGKLDRSKWEQKPPEGRGGDAADDNTGDAVVATGDAAAAAAAQASTEGQGQQQDDQKEKDEAAAHVPRVVGKLDPSKLMFGQGSGNDAYDTNGAAAGGSSSAGAPVNVGKLDMSKFLSVKKYEPNTPQKATRAPVGKLNVARLQLGGGDGGEAESEAGAKPARSVGKLNLAGMAAFQNPTKIEEEQPSRRHPKQGSTSSRSSHAPPAAASSGGGGEVTRSRAESMEVRAHNAKSQLEKLRELKAKQQLESRKSSSGCGGGGSGIASYSYGPLDTAGDGMLLLIWHPGIAGIVVTTRDALIASNKQICSGAAIFCAGPL